MRRRVVVWGTGTIGMFGLRGLINHRDYELVGVHAWGADKVGKDAGDLLGTEKTGIITTDDVAALLALKPDCLVYQGNYASREEECVNEVIPFLEAGINVVGPSLMDLIASEFGRQEFVEPIARACEKGGSSIFCGGTDPGYMSVGHVFAMLASAGRIDRITFVELGDLQGYGAVDSLKLYGFGEPLDYLPPMFTDDVGAGWHISTLLGIADYLAVEIEDVTSKWETAGLDRDFEAAIGPIAANTTAATRWSMDCMYKGQPLISYRKVERIHPEAGPDFERNKDGGVSGYVIQIDGDPDFRCETYLSLAAGCAMTALHPINAINAVCEAQPGIVGQLDMPHTYSRNVRT
jgi:2,4-diaminopentanoate dehydrogenase